MRLALILPRKRLGAWHNRLAESLSRIHDVRIYLDGGAPAYPWSLRTWLSAERLLYGERGASTPRAAAEDDPTSPQFDIGSFDRVIDLSERPQPRNGAICVRYDGAADSMALVSRLLLGQTPHLAVSGDDPQRVFAESRPSIDDKAKLTRGLELSFSRCISLVERALQATATAAAARPLTSGSAPTYDLAAYIARFFTAKALKVVENIFMPARGWSVAVRRTQGGFTQLASDDRRYFADPFLFARDGRTFLFAEEYRYATQKGLIAAVEIVDGKPQGVPVPILERPFHISYPFVFADAGSIYMLPEMSERKALELYRAVDFPWRWELDCVLMEGPALADPTLVFHEDRWWLFAASGEHGSLDHDELLIFYSDELRGSWRPHAQNPVKSDCRSARPAGRMVREGKRLLRPAQNCEKAYGGGIVWNEIVELSPTRFREIEIARLDASDVTGLDCLHAFDQAGSLQAIDYMTAHGWGSRHLPTGEEFLRLGHALDMALQRLAPITPVDLSRTAAGDDCRLGGRLGWRRSDTRVSVVCNIRDEIVNDWDR